MNWKKWAGVALVGVLTTAQGIEFKDAPTIKQVIVEAVGKQPNFYTTRVQTTNYHNSYSWSADNIAGVVGYITINYSNTNEPYYKIPQIPKGLTEKQGQEYFRKHITPPKDLGKYAHSIMLSLTTNDAGQKNASKIFQQLSDTFLKRCYGFTPDVLKSADVWLANNYGKNAETTIGAIQLKLLTTPDTNAFNAQILAINGFPPQNIGVLYPNQQGWTQFCRE